MSKREARDERRFRAEQARLAERRRRARLNLLVVGGAVLVGVVLLALVALSIHRRGQTSTPTTPTTPVTAPSTVLTASPTTKSTAKTSTKTTAKTTAKVTRVTPTTTAK